MPEPIDDQPAGAESARIPQRLCNACLWMAFATLVTLSVLAAAAAALLYTLEQRPQYIADWLGQQIERRVNLKALELSWNDGAPLLRLQGLIIRDPELQAGGLALEQSEIRIDVLSSLREGAVKLSKITVRGANIRLRRGADGQWLVAGLGSQGQRYQADVLIGQALAAIPKGAEFTLENASLGIDGVLGKNPRNAHLEFSPVSLNLRKLEHTSRLSGAIGLPGLQQQRPLRFSLRWAHDVGTPMRQSKLALIATQLPLSRTPVLAQLLDLDALDGVLGLTLDINIRNGAVTDAAGRFELSKAALNFGPAQPPLQLDALHSVVDFRKLANGWRLNFLKMVLSSQRRSWPQTTASLTRIEDSLGHRERLAVDELPVAAVIALLQGLPIPTALRDRFIAGLQPQGQLENIELSRIEQPAKPDKSTLSLDFKNLLYRHPDTGNRISAVQGSLTVFDRGGRISIKTAGIHLTQDPAGGQIPPLSAQADLRWQQGDGQLIMDLDKLRISNPSIRFDTQGQILWPTDTGPLGLNLHTRASAVRTQDLKPFLSTGVVPQGVAEWISKSLHGGQFYNLKADVKGKVANLAELSKLVSFSSEFRNVTLDYASGWPRLNRLHGTLKLAAQQLRFNLRKGDVSGAQVIKASGRINDISVPAPVIRVKGMIQGRSEQAITFISTSPLKSRFSGLLNTLDVIGPTKLALELDIPLSDKPLKVRGTLHMQDNLIHVPALRSGLDRVRGKLSFNADGPEQGHFSAQYLARPIRLNLNGGIENGAITRLTIDGRTDSAGLVRHLFNVGAVNSSQLQALPLFSRLTGEADWRVALDIPTRGSKELQLGLQVESDLYGMALNLPAPLGKSKGQRRTLSVRTQLTDQPVRQFKIDYGDHLNAVLEVKPDGPHYRLSRGEIILDKARAKLPTEEGLRVAGRLAYLSVDEWVSVLGQAQDTAPTRVDSRRVRPLAEVRSVRLDVDALDALSSRFNNVQMNVAHDARKGWGIDLQGRELDGQIEIKEAPSQAAIAAYFKRLSIQPSPANTPPADIDPRTLPALDLIIDKLQYKDLNLGLIKLILRPFDQGTQVQQLFALSEAYEIRGKGDWRRQDGQTQSALSLQVNGNNFGKLLAAIGYPNTGVDGGAVDMTINGQWPGSPFDFDTTTLQGKLNFRASNGFLRDFEPGMTGRVFGLFTLTTLPRRLLRLDFSDLFVEGLGYELLEGSFDLDAGNAYTNNLKLETDTSRIEIEGRVGLILRDYDQVMTVTPKLSSNLALAPLWLAEKFLDKKLINDAFSYRYTITGSWDDPQVQRIRVKPPKVELN